MSEDIVVRGAVSSDYEEVIGLLGEVDKLHGEEVPWLFRTAVEQPRPLGWFEKWLQDDRSGILVAELAGKVVGVVTVILRTAPEFPVFIPQSWGVVDNLVVAHAARRRGIGTRLMRAAEAWGAERRAPWIELGVYEFNRGARDFYAALGYAPTLTKMRKVAIEP
jgi:GNAT superfamily N-acetyltransferase